MVDADRPLPEPAIGVFLNVRAAVMRVSNSLISMISEPIEGGSEGINLTFRETVRVISCGVQDVAREKDCNLVGFEALLVSLTEYCEGEETGASEAADKAEEEQAEAKDPGTKEGLG
jgi:hypothetical protein